MGTPLLHATSFVSQGCAVAVAALFSAIWQGAVLAVAVALCLRMMPGLSAAARSAIWMNIFALLVLLHFIPALEGHRAQASPMQASAVHLDVRWSIVIAGAWAMLSLWRCAQLILSAVRLHRIAGRAIPICPEAALRELLRQKSGGMQSGRSAELCTSTEVERPSVFGFFRPRILVPPELIESLSPQELQLVVLHEMEHLRRADDWSNLLQKMSLVLLPLNPVLLWVERRLCAERELACDDRVLKSIPGRKAYAACLTRLAEYSILQRRLSLALGAWERRSELVRRVHRILRRPATALNGRVAMVATASLIAGALGCTAVLARSPQLVSFDPSAQLTVQSRSLPISGIREMSFRELGGTPQLVKAVMPQRPVPARVKARPVHSSSLKPAVVRNPVPSQQAVMVLTEWQEIGPAPQLVFAVAHYSQPSYAVVRISNGWLIVQI